MLQLAKRAAETLLPEGAAAHGPPKAPVAHCGWTGVSCRESASAGHFGTIAARRAEVSAEHLRSHHEGGLDAGVVELLVVFVAVEKEELVAALVEPGSRNDHRPADGGAGIVVGFVRPGGDPVFLLVGLERIQHCIAGIEVDVPMEAPAAGFGDDIDHHRPLGVIGGKVRGKDLDFGDHVLVGGDRDRIAIRARIEGMTPIHGHVYRLTVDVFVTQGPFRFNPTVCPLYALELTPPLALMTAPGMMFTISVASRLTRVSCCRSPAEMV